MLNRNLVVLFAKILSFVVVIIVVHFLLLVSLCELIEVLGLSELQSLDFCQKFLENRLITLHLLTSLRQVFYFVLAIKIIVELKSTKRRITLAITLAELVNKSINLFLHLVRILAQLDNCGQKIADNFWLSHALAEVLDPTWCGRPYDLSVPVSYTHLTLPTKRIV